MIRLGLYALAVVAGGGTCQSSQVESAVDPGACGRQVACPASLECREGACVGTTGADHPITLRIRPGRDRSLAPVELTNIQVDTPVRTLAVAVQVPLQVALDGQVLDPDGRSVPATRVVAVPGGGLATDPLVVEGRRSAVNPAIFSLAIAPWWPTETGMRSLTPYTLHIALPGLPPWEAALRWNQVEPRVVVEIPRTDAVVPVRGQVRVAGTTPIPLPNLRVVAFDLETDQPRSSEGLTDAEGQFQVTFWPMGGPRSVRLRVQSTDPTRPLPVLERVIEVPTEAVVFELVDPQRVFTATVRVEVDGVPLAGAELRLQTDTEAGTYTSRGRTGADGRVSLPAYPGRYRVDVVASVEDDARVTRVERELSAAAPAIIVSPLPRTPVAGRVLDLAGEPVAGAPVEARLLQSAFGDPTLARPDDRPPTRTFRTTTREDGTYLLALDPGVHRLFVDAGRGLPAWSGEIAFSGEQPRTLDPVTLPAAAVVVARLVDEDGAPVVDTLVEAWSAAEPAVRLALTRSGPDGTVRLRVPVTRPVPTP